MERRRSFTPVLILVGMVAIPLLYVASYLLLVVPEGRYGTPDREGWRTFIGHYHYAPTVLPKFYRPLELIDQRLRPDAWPDPPIVHPPL